MTFPLTDAEQRALRAQVPPALPQGDDREDVTAWQTIKAAARGERRRPGDDVLFRRATLVIEATKSLGYPVVMGFALLGFLGYFGNQFLVAQHENSGIQREQLAQNASAALLAQDRSTAALKEMAAAQSEANELTRSLMVDLGLKPPKKRGQR